MAVSGGNNMQAKPVAEAATRNRPGALILALCALAVSGVFAWQAANLIRQDLLFTAVQTEVGFWGRGNYLPDEQTRDNVGNQLDRLLSQSPSHPGYLGLAAHYYAWRAYWDEPPASLDYAWRALRSQALAQENRPAHRPGWVKMQGYATGLEGAGQQLRQARERLTVLSPPGRLVKPETE